MTTLSPVIDSVYSLNNPVRIRSENGLRQVIRAQIFGARTLTKEAWEVEALEAARHRIRRNRKLHFKRMAP